MAEDSKTKELHAAIAQAEAELTKALDENFREVLRDAVALQRRKGTDYDRTGPITRRMVFGDVSFAHEVYKKADRAIGLVRGALEGQEAPANETLDDNVMDILVYCGMWLATRRTK